MYNIEEIKSKLNHRFNPAWGRYEVDCVGYFQSSFFSFEGIIKRIKELDRYYEKHKGDLEILELRQVAECIRAYLVRLKNVMEETPDYLLWEFFSKNHDLTLTDGEVNDIVEEVKKYLKAVNSE